MKCLTLAVAFALTLVLPVAGSDAARRICGVGVAGGTPREEATARAVVCRMPGTPIQSIQILEQPPDAPADAVWLAFTIPRKTGRSLGSFLREIRGKWDADIAAAAIRDSFVDANLRRVVSYDALPPGVQPDPNSAYGIALPRWGIRRWTTGAPSRNLDRHADTWPVLQAKLDALARHYHVKTTLIRYEPLGRAPLVWISTARAARFLATGGFAAYEHALHFGEARYDGVFIGLVSQPVTAVTVWATYRGRQGNGCGVFRGIRGADKICPSD